MAQCMALANSLLHGELRRQEPGSELARASRLMAVFPDGVYESAEAELLTAKPAWQLVFRVADIVSVHSCADSDVAFDVTVGTADVTLQFEAASPRERIEWIRVLHLVKELSAPQEPARVAVDDAENAGAFMRFAPSDSEDDETDSDAESLREQASRVQLARKPERSSVVTLTILRVFVLDHVNARFSVAIPLSESSRDQVTVLQVKLDAISQLRKSLVKEATGLVSEAKEFLTRLLNHDPDWFVLCIDEPRVWMKEEHHTKRKTSDLTQRPYTAYVIDVTFDNMTWQIQRRYQDFHHLHQQLKLKHGPLGATLPQLPPKRVFTPVDGDFVLRRRVLLAQYLQLLIEYPVFGQDVLVLSFLGVVSRSRDPEVNKSGKNVMHITAVHTGLDYGDIVLFSCRFGASVIQRKLTRSTYDHVGIVVPGPSRNLLRILEATGEGIQVYSLKTRLMAYSREVSKSIVVRKLDGPRNKATMELLNEFVKNVDGNSYSIFGILQARGDGTMGLEPGAA
ncbi:hypothetical protein P43SY_002230 [Pythium insidiosum]|uniref:PX domain-containing protein n=1 Tax=Pythium insidiosum TaxID=114742 RepID=A0AAD5MIJ7_PYTIN|nr:hypothetical protein P43SY_002230 [Pythium insidiosum]